LITGEAVSSVVGDPATLALAPDGSLTGGTGCRTFTGHWREANGEILFNEFGMDEGECDPALAAQDNHVVGVLGDGFRAAVEGQRLTLTSTGNLGLGYLTADE
jgi:heat shock protein HslJ